MNPDILSLLDARSGHFRFESGHHGDLWLDLDALFRQPQRLSPHLQELGARLQAYDINAICGPLTGGAFIAYGIAAQFNLIFAYTERYSRETADDLYAVGYRLPPALTSALKGKSVAIVDDVINAGSATRATLDTLLAAGAIPRVVGALLTLGTTAKTIFKERGLSLVSLAEQTNPLWTPDACPLCAQNIPLEDLT